MAMTDDEINRKVAEIEGWSLRLGLDREMYWMDRDQTKAWQAPPPYATDWAWCGPLVEKHALDLIRHPFANLWVAETMTTGGPYCEYDTPQRAICLAVIAAREAKPLEQP